MSLDKDERKPDRLHILIGVPHMDEVTDVSTMPVQAQVKTEEEEDGYEDSQVATHSSLFYAGQEFNSFAEFEKHLQHYCAQTYTQFVRTSSVTMDYYVTSCKKDIKVNRSLLFSRIKLVCVKGGGRPGPSTSKGIRKVIPKKLGCPVFISLSLSRDYQKLFVKDLNLERHNHPVDKVSYHLKHLDEETEDEILKLVNFIGNKRLARRLIKQRLSEEIGMEIDSRQLQLLELRIANRHKLLKDQISNPAHNGEDFNNYNDEDEDMEEDISDGEQDNVISNPSVTQRMSADSPGSLTHRTHPSADNPPDTHSSTLATQTLASQSHMSSPTQDTSPRVADRLNNVSVMVTRSKGKSVGSIITSSVPNGSARTISLLPPTASKTNPASDDSRTKAKSSEVPFVSANSDANRQVKVALSNFGDSLSEKLERKRRMEIEERKLAIKEEMLELKKKKLEQVPLQEELLAIEKKKVVLLEDVSSKLEKVLKYLESNSANS